MAKGKGGRGWGRSLFLFLFPFTPLWDLSSLGGILGSPFVPPRVPSPGALAP